MIERDRERDRQNRYPALADREWLEAQVQLKPASQIARELGCHVRGVQYRVRRFGIVMPNRATHQFTEDSKRARCASLRKKALETARRGAEHHHWSAAPTYSGIHQWINGHFPKSGYCEHCGAVGRMTHYASIGHGYTRNRHDWLELCVPCHRRLDRG